MKVVVLDDYQGVGAAYADWSGLDVTFVREHLSGPALLDVLRDAPVVVAMRERTTFGRDVLSQLPALRMLVTTGMRNAAIDLEAAAELGITVSGTRGLDSPTAELTWGLILGLVRQLPFEDAAMRSGAWQTTVGMEIAGKTLGVIGLGKLGTQVARVGLAFGMRVVAWSQNLSADHAQSLGVEAVSKEELLSSSDIVTLHLKLSERTTGILCAADLALMRPSAYLVNTSRGPLIDHAALLAALAEGRLAGAALDVYDEEPLPASHPLRSAPRTVLTPHLGYVTDGTYRVFYGDAVEDIHAFAAGSPLRLLEN